MCKYLFIVAFAYFSCTFLLSCTRDFGTKAPAEQGARAYLKIIHAAPSMAKIFTLNKDSFNVFVGGNKVNGTVMTYNSFFPSTAILYSAVQPGTYMIRLSLNSSTTPDSSTFTSFSRTFVAGQYYTLLLTDSIKSLRDSSQIFVNDIYTVPQTGYYNMRFIHAVLNDTVGKTVDIYSTRRNSNIYTAIKPGTITAFTALAYNAQLNDTLYVRRTGTTFNLAPLLASTFSNQRVYTLCYRGDSASTGTKARGLVTYLHR